MKELLKHFANEGFGWHCLKCAAALQSDAHISRVMTEGEAESKEPDFSGKALAKWADSNKSSLKCDHCGVTERIAD